MLFKVASFVRIGSGGNGPPRCELILSTAAASESESKAESQAVDARFSSAINSGLEVAAGRGKTRLMSHHSLTNEQIGARDMSHALAKALDLLRWLKRIILSGHLFRHLEEVVAHHAHGNFASDTSALDGCASSAPQPRSTSKRDRIMAAV